MIEDPTIPYEVPPNWTPEHVMIRMIRAFETLGRLRIKVGPKGHGRGWPSYVHEYGDLLAQEETEVAERKRRTFERRDVFIPPTAHDVSLMEESFQWPVHYGGCRNIVPWAWRRSSGRMRGEAMPIRAVIIEAAVIARYLVIDKVMVR